ncbi:MAG TPA: DUF5683 domain-containing protein, partial [Leptospiraceae bacterium]|nr:DUF5683 domain-containing protein [Leptospiraceae bacterium]
ILDACREIINREEKGIGDSGLKEKKFEEAEIAATFYSTREGYYSYEDEKMSNGVYTSFLIQGMKGEADANNDGIVTLSELEIYVQNSVNDWATKNSKKQKPFTKIYKEKHGDLGIVSSPRKPTPEEVKAQNKEKDKVTFHIPAPFKSAVLPGWGQFSNDQKIKGGLFASAFLLGGGYLISKYADHSSAMNEYNGAKNMTNLSFLANTYPESFYLSLYGYRSGISAQSKMTGLSRDFSAAALAVSLFYAYNIFDAWYFSKAESPKTAGSFHWNLNYQKEFTPVSGQMQGMYTVEYTERF